MLTGPIVAQTLKKLGVTHLVGIPDSHLGTWEAAIEAEPGLRLVRVCREGEAFAVAGGLLLGGKRPVVCIQCTGLFEAGDSLRNMVHDLKLPLFMIVGLRSWYAHRQGRSLDSCPRFAEPILTAWEIPHVLLEENATGDDLARAYRQAEQEKRPGAVLIAE